MIDFKNNYEIEELEKIMLPTLDLTQNNWITERGGNLHKLFVDHNDNDKTKAIENVIYTWPEVKRFPVDFYKEIDWLDNDGNIIHTKIIKKSQVSDDKLGDIKFSMSRRRMRHLEDAANNLRKGALSVPEPYKTQFLAIADSIDFLFNHYSVEVDEYLKRQTNRFEEKLIADYNHIDGSLLEIVNGAPTMESAGREAYAQGVKFRLNLPARLPDAKFPIGLIVYTSILYQLTGVIPT